MIDGEKLKISAAIPLPNKIHEREIVKTDFPDTFNSGVTLGPINQTKMERIWTKHKQLNTTLKPKVFVAMSGGVDSSVAAVLLTRSGDFDVVGTHMICWEGCDSKDDQRDAFKVALKLGIPFLTFDFKKEYRERVFEHMIKEYAVGRTPNPDVMCNSRIKFGVFLEKALEMGTDYVATGHYIKIQKSKCKMQNDNAKSKIIYRLFKAKDSNKDQSYFLWTLNQEQLRHCLFPIGDYLKSEVRELARKFGLHVAEKRDSQGLCFVGKVKFRDFLKNLLSKNRIIQNMRSQELYHEDKKKNGKIVTSDGKIIGKHKGFEFCTIGQRRGIGASGNKAPYYVARKNMTDNTLIVAKKNDPALYEKEIFANNINWVSGNELKLPLRCEARIRYRQPLQDCEICATQRGGLKVLFKKPVWAPASGQSIVFYKNNQMLGGGVIS